MTLEENEEELKREFRRLDEILRTDPSPLDALNKILVWIQGVEPSATPPKTTEFFLKQMLPKFVTTLLRRSDLAEIEEDSVDSRINSFFLKVIELVVKHLPFDYPELTETLCKLFTVAQTPFYQKYGVKETIIREDPADEPDVRGRKMEISVTAYFVNNVAHFGRLAGFDEIFKRIERRDPKVSLSSVRWLIRAVAKARDGLDVNFLRKFNEPLQVAAARLILDLTDEELKNEDKKVIAEVILQMDFLLRAVFPIPKVNLKIEQFRLAVALKCFRSPYLEKRLNGLNDIKELISSVTRKEELVIRLRNNSQGAQSAHNQLLLMWMTPHILAKWIRKNNILEHLYGQNLHPELLRRCVDIPRFLLVQSENCDDFLDLIWDASLGKHESIQHIIYNTIGDLASSLSASQIDHLYERIQKIPYENYDATTLMLIRTFTSHAINRSKNTKKIYGLEILWNLMQDSTPVTSEITFHALTTLCEFIVWPPCVGFRQQFVELCVANLQKNESVPQSLKLLGKILETFVIQPKRKKGDNSPQIVEWLESHYHLLDLLLADLTIYNERARVTVLANNWVDPGAINFSCILGKSPHLQQVKDRLDFLDQILGTSPLVLTEAQVDVLWETAILKALTAEERDLAFNWLENARGKLVPREDPFTDEVTQYLFLNKVPTLDLSHLSIPGFSFFEFYFRYVNWKNGYFIQRVPKEYTVCSFDLLGLDMLWRIALEARNPVVGKNAIISLNCMHKNLLAELRPVIPKQREDYIRTCMQQLREASEALPAAVGDDLERVKLRIDRCLTLIRTFMDEFETKAGVNSRRHGIQSRGSALTISVTVLQGPPKFELTVYSNETAGALRQKIADHLGVRPSTLRIITFGKELKHDGDTLGDLKFYNGQSIHIAKRVPLEHAGEPPKPTPMIEEVDDEAILPSNILSNQVYFNQLFHMLNLGEEIGQKIWDLLMLLPTNRQMLDDLVTLQDGSQESPNWPELLDPRSTFKLLYSLQIVDSLALSHQNSEETAERIKDKEEWCRKFVAKKGVEHLLKILLMEDLLDRNRGAKRGVCAALLLKITTFFALQPTISPSLRENVLQNTTEPAVFIQALLRITWNVATQVQELQSLRPVGPVVAQTEAEEGEITRHAISLLVATCLAYVVNLRTFLESSKLREWLIAVLFASDISIRVHTANGIYTLCCLAHDVTLGPLLPHSFFLNLLLELLPSVGGHAPTCEQYFELLNKILTDACTTGASQFEELFISLIQAIKSHLVVEKRHSFDEDKLLIGLLTLACTLVRSEATFKLRAATEYLMVGELFWKCLFDIPTMHDHGSQAPPKCKTRGSRNAAFRLLFELAKDCEPALQEIISLLLPHHQGGEKRLQWHYQPAGFEKAMCGFVGLKNLGATCYMNSLMQQFYTIPSLRYGILAVDKEEEDKSNSLLYQLQMMFGYLQESEKKFYDTIPFCGAYKDNGQPMNPAVQMDADEFFNIFFDRLESSISNTPQATILKRFFGGSLSNQIISKECPHISERQETFFTLSLEVKGKKNIQESLDLYVQGDVLDGDNKYFCGTCSTKVDAVKRCCIHELPNNLIIHLKRFEFDLELMRRIKLNDFCEFPTHLNMEAYTKEGLAKRDNQQAADLPQRPVGYYDYELAGVLVHTGTADSGHYYSFIRERDTKAPGTDRQWYSFNDVIVEPFDPREIPRACFGGSEPLSQFDASSGKYVQRIHPRANNAYMLFYERVSIPDGTLEVPGVSKEVFAEPSKIVPRAIYQSVWEENMRFLNDKNIFDVDYFSFLWSIVGLRANSSHLDYVRPSDSQPSLQPIELGTRFLIETLSHAKEKQNFKGWVDELKTRFEDNIPACIWFLDTLSSEGNTWLKQMLLSCTVAEVREAFANLLVQVMSNLSRFERPIYMEEEAAILLEASNRQGDAAVAMEIVEGKEDVDSSASAKFDSKTFRTSPSQSYIIRVLDRLLDLLKEAPNYWRNIAQFFYPLREVARWGAVERQYFMTRNTIALLIDFYLGDESPSAKAGKRKPKMGDKVNPPNLCFMLDTLSTLIRGSASNKHESNPPPTQLADTILDISEVDKTHLAAAPFYHRITREATNSVAMIEIATHLSWENVDNSKLMIDVACQGINNSEHELFKPFFDQLVALFDLEDTQTAWRVELGLDSLIAVIHENLQYRNATFHSIKFLTDITTKNAAVRAWLFQFKNRWFESWVMSANHDLVRTAAEELVHVLIPEIPYPLPPGTVPEDRQKLQILYDHLLSLLSKATLYAKGEVEPTKQGDDPVWTWKLCAYFRLLKWCIVDQIERNLFLQFSSEFVALWVQMDTYQLELDENKKEITSLWYHILQGSPENVNVITSNDPFIIKLFDYFVSLRPNPKFIEYNNATLPSFYNIIRLCCEHSESFRKKLVSARNFEWAVRHMLISTDYLPVSAVLFEVVKTLVYIPELRVRHIPIALLKEKLLHCSRLCLRYLDLLLTNLEDYNVFFEHGGLDGISHLLGDRRQDKEKLDEKTIESTRLALTILINATSYLLSPNARPRQKLDEIVQHWEARNNLLQSLVTLIDMTLEDSVVVLCYKLIEHIVTLDPTCLEKLLINILPDHEELFARVQGFAPNPPAGTEVPRRRPRLRIHTIIEEGAKDPVQLRYVDMYYHFVYKICSAALGRLNSKFLPSVINLALFIALETAQLESMICMMSSLLNKLSDYEHCKLNPLLDTYVVAALTKNSHLLLNTEVLSFLQKAFSIIRQRLTDPQRQAIITAQSDRIRNLVETLTALSLDAELEVAIPNAFLQAIRTFNIVSADEGLKNYFTRLDRKPLTSLLEISSNERLAIWLSSTPRLETTNNLLQYLRDLAS